VGSSPRVEPGTEGRRRSRRVHPRTSAAVHLTGKIPVRQTQRTPPSSAFVDPPPADDEQPYRSFRGFAQTATTPRSAPRNGQPNIKLRHQAIAFVSAGTNTPVEPEQDIVIEEVTAALEVEFENEDEDEDEEEDDDDIDDSAIQTNIMDTDGEMAANTAKLFVVDTQVSSKHPQSLVQIK
jgi:hypothetical protein